MESELSCLPSFFSSWICLLRSTIWTPGKNRLFGDSCLFAWHPWPRFTSTRETRDECCGSSRARITRRKTGSQEKPIWRQIRLCNTSVVKLDPKWHYLDLRDSDLISIVSLTHSLTLGFIYGLNVHECGKSEDVKINLSGKLIWLAENVGVISTLYLGNIA